jgi:putative colanic acid biosynthesis acetyltransferase WcaF
VASPESNAQVVTPETASNGDASARTVSPVSTRDKIRRLLWSMVQNTLYRYSFHTWSGWRAFLLRCFGAKIGRQCTIRRTSRVYYPWLLEMGDLACLGDEANAYNLGKITIEERATISQEAYLCAGTHDFSKMDLPLITKPIIIGKDVWVCARAFVGPGVTIGEGAVVGACAVVMRDVAPWKIVAGNRATVVGERRLQE